MRIGDHLAIVLTATPEPGWKCNTCGQHWPEFTKITMKCEPEDKQ